MCARYIIGRHIKLENGVWEYLNSGFTLEQANLLNIDKYINKRKKTVENISTHRKFKRIAGTHMQIHKL
jgi:hypothetical protein